MIRMEILDQETVFDTDIKLAFTSMENTSQDSKSMVFILTRRYTKSNSVCDLGRTMLASFC